MTTEANEFAAFFEEPLDIAAYERHADAAHESFAARERFERQLNEYRTRVEQGAGTQLRLAAGLLLLGRFVEALERFERADEEPQRYWFSAQALQGLGRLEEAIEHCRKAAQLGWDAFDADMRIAALHVQAGQVDDAQKLLDKHAGVGADRAEWHYVHALIAEARDEREPAVEALTRALTLDEVHESALFRLARLRDMMGDDEGALDLYDRLAERPRAHVNALINAAVVYEDIGRYSDAIRCLQRVLKAYPNHTRARLFLKDVRSCQEMIIVEQGEDQGDASKRLLDMPLTEFEFSVRARNCLKKMNIRTIGELIQLSEAELLAYKNFGETSLNEIKAMLQKKGLRLGQPPEEVDLVEAAPAAPAAERPVSVPPGQEAVLSKPVSELELSVRARRCLQRLNVQTLGDLVQFSEADLLATRNFGETSLSEVKTRLAEHGLQLEAKKG